MTFPLRPLGVGEVIARAFDLYRRDFSTLARLVAVVVVPFELMAFGVSAVIPDVAEGSDPTGTEALAVFSGVILLGLLDLVSAHLATAASFRAVSDGYLGRPVDGFASLRHANDRLGSLLWVALLSALLIGVGLVAFVIPGVYLAIALSMAVPVVVAEGLRGREALARSRALVRGRWWPVAGTQVLALIIAGAAAGILVSVPQILAGSPDGAVGTALAVASALAAGIITMPFTAAVLVVLYVDLRVRNDGFDADDLARSAGTDGPPDPPPTPPSPPPPPPPVT